MSVKYPNLKSDPNVIMAVSNGTIHRVFLFCLPYFVCKPLNTGVKVSPSAHVRPIEVGHSKCKVDEGEGDTEQR
jgi:hypothetical protein